MSPGFVDGWGLLSGRYAALMNEVFHLRTVAYAIAASEHLNIDIELTRVPGDKQGEFHAIGLGKAGTADEDKVVVKRFATEQARQDFLLTLLPLDKRMVYVRPAPQPQEISFSWARWRTELMCSAYAIAGFFAGYLVGLS